MRNFCFFSNTPFVKQALFLGLLILGLSCSEDSAGPDLNADIPPDPSNITVPVPVVNNLRPTATVQKVDENENRIKMNLLGMLTEDDQIFDPVYDAENPQESNIFVVEDGTVKGLKITDGGAVNLPVDMVFTVDNSGSMSQEADSVASGITAFAQFLANQGFDIRFACVGFSGFVNGAINFNDYPVLDSYLNTRPAFPGGPAVTGTSRTRGFSGPDSVALDSVGFLYGSGSENGVAGIFFAEDNFDWRANALRIYINFTDEPTQPRGDFSWSTDTLCSVLEGRATVHTVWSAGDTTFFGAENPLFSEKPWRMSDCTGGETRIFQGDAAGLSLLDLPVTNVVEGSKLVEFITSDAAALHTLEIIVKNGETDDGKTVYQNIGY